MGKKHGFGKRMEFNEKSRMVYIAQDQKEEPSYEVVLINGDIIGLDIPKDNTVVLSPNLFAVRGDDDLDSIEPIGKVTVNLYGYIFVRNEDVEKIGEKLEIHSLHFTEKTRTVTEFLTSIFNIDEM